MTASNTVQPGDKNQAAIPDKDTADTPPPLPPSVADSPPPPPPPPPQQPQDTVVSETLIIGVIAAYPLHVQPYGYAEEKKKKKKEKKYHPTTTNLAATATRLRPGARAAGYGGGDGW
ncbi:hypothetical protein PG996_011578 [Apiospora saccharicola]|uniref:Uncharacterized protein n=1 Tax=Apiospora saccharicola TaxID=335842 RepID=A0ABR1UFG1_9PEZI